MNPEAGGQCWSDVLTNYEFVKHLGEGGKVVLAVHKSSN